MIQEVLSHFLGALTAVLFLLFLCQALRLSEFLLLHQTTLKAIGDLLVPMFILFLPFALPLSFLIAVLAAVGRLSGDSEWVMLRACGWSSFRIALPLIILATFFVGMCGALSLNWVPQAEIEFKKGLVDVANASVTQIVKPGTFQRDFFHLLIYAEKVSPENNELSGVFLYDARAPKSPLTYVAQRAKILPKDSKNPFSVLELHHGSLHHLGEVPDPSQQYEKVDFEVFRLNLGASENPYGWNEKPKMLTQKELIEKIRTTDPTTQNSIHLKNEFWRRYSVAISPLFFVFLGIGMGGYRPRQVKFSAILQGILVSLFFWGSQIGGLILAQKGYLPPLIGMCLPYFGLGGASVFFLRKAYF